MAADAFPTAADFGLTEDTGTNLSGDTGKNDPNSIWATGLLSGISSLTTSATNVLGALKKPAAAKPAATNWTIPLLIGGAVLVLLVVLGLARK